MQPNSPLAIPVESAPNFELLRRHGWSVNNICGAYCVAFRGADELVLEWQNGHWQRVGGRGATTEL
jgi:hypothetical protein